MGGYSAVTCDIKASFTTHNRLSFYVDRRFGNYLTTDVYDAFMVAMLFPAMYYNEPIEIQGCVSETLYHNIVQYVESIIHDFAPDRTKHIEIKVNGFKDAEKNDILHIGTGFSGGIDSFSTLNDNFFNTTDLKYRIDTLFFFHIGQYGNVENPHTAERAKNRFSITERFASEIGVPAIMLNTNLFVFYKPEWEYQVGVLNRIASILVFQRALKRYYLSNAYTYGEMIDLAHDRNFLEEFADPYIMPLLSPPGLQIVCDGAQYRRTIKTKRVSILPLARKYLNVCINSDDKHVDAINCSECSKCMRTMMALESVGRLAEFNTVFDIDKYRKKHWKYKKQQILRYKFDAFARDNVDFALQNGTKMPSIKRTILENKALRILSLPFRACRKILRILINRTIR